MMKSRSFFLRPYGLYMLIIGMVSGICLPASRALAGGTPLGLTDITTSPWKLYRKHREKSGFPGGTYVNVRGIENCFGCPTDRHQVYAIIAAHEYGHQLFFGARHF